MDINASFFLLLRDPLPLFTLNVYAEMFAGARNTSGKASCRRARTLQNGKSGIGQGA